MSEPRTLTDLLREMADLEDRCDERLKAFEEAEAAMKAADAECDALEDRIGVAMEDGVHLLFYRAGDDRPHVAYLDCDGSLVIHPLDSGDDRPAPDAVPIPAPGPDGGGASALEVVGYAALRGRDECECESCRRAKEAAGARAAEEAASVVSIDAEVS